jgi:hypothetical protein
VFSELPPIVFPGGLGVERRACRAMGEVFQDSIERQRTFRGTLSSVRRRLFAACFGLLERLECSILTIDFRPEILPLLD